VAWRWGCPRCCEATIPRPRQLSLFCPSCACPAPPRRPGSFGTGRIETCDVPSGAHGRHPPTGATAGMPGWTSGRVADVLRAVRVLLAARASTCPADWSLGSATGHAGPPAAQQQFREKLLRRHGPDVLPRLIPGIDLPHTPVGQSLLGQRRGVCLAAPEVPWAAGCVLPRPAVRKPPHSSRG